MTNSIQTRDRTSVLSECLSRSRRRYLLHCLNTAGQPLALADLSEDIAGREVEPQAEVDEECVKDVYLSLYHTHVPKLADANFVEYDQKRREVTLIEYPLELESTDGSRALMAN